jgi:hypothetical protein
MSSFFLLLVSQIFFVFEGLVEHFYVMGESVQLLGYLTLLFAMGKMLLKK